MLPSLVGLVVGIGLGLGACAGELANPERFADCQPGGVEAMFEERCTGPCHAGDQPEAGLDLTGADIAARLIGKASSCDGRMIVDPDGLETDDHLLLDKLGDSPRCGAQMPFGAAPLTDVERECVRRWIDDAIAGAHGEPLGVDEVRLTKQALEWPADRRFYVPEDALQEFRTSIKRGAAQLGTHLGRRPG